jgi:3-phosphoglycerate kinase
MYKSRANSFVGVFVFDLSYAMNKKTLDDVDFLKKTVLLRLDLNVPLKEGKILDDERILQSLPTIQFLLENKAKVIILSHLKRPKEWDESLSLKPIADYLKTLLPGKIEFFSLNIKSHELKEKIEALEFGKAILLENIRFYPEESTNDVEFSKYLASLAQIYVNDAFGTMHRAHASTQGVAHYLPSCIGYLVEKELLYVKALSEDAQKPVTVIMGGGKISTKINLLKGLMNIADNILIGGGMVFTFLKAMNYPIGKSLFEDGCLSQAQDILQEAKNRNRKLIFPLDIVCAKQLKGGIETVTYTLDEGIPDDYMGLDIGEKSITLFESIIQNSETIFWNGPLGVFEVPPFDKGTKEIALAIGKRSENKSVMSIVGGGESVMATKLYGIDKVVNHISTGGGALLEMLEGIKLPGLDIISPLK